MAYMSIKIINLTNRKSGIIFAIETEHKPKKRRTMATIHLTKGGFDRLIDDTATLASGWKYKGARPALIDFYAPWCGPCQQLLPTIEELGVEYEGKVDIYKVNIDSEEELTTLFGIRSVPTLIFIPMEGAPRRAMGLLPKSQLKEQLDVMIK